MEELLDTHYTDHNLTVKARLVISGWLTGLNKLMSDLS